MKYIGDGIPIGMSYDGSPMTNTTGTDAGNFYNFKKLLSCSTSCYFPLVL
jgi:hypothetical protein